MKTLAGFVLVGLLAGLIPFGLIALARSQPSPLPPVHPIQDLFKQQRFRRSAATPCLPTAGRCGRGARRHGRADLGAQ